MLHRRPVVKSERIVVAPHRRPRHRPHALRKAGRGPGLSARSQLGIAAAGAALERSGVAAADVGYVIMGQVLQAGSGQIPSRQVSVGIGLGPTVGSETVNKVCASGMRAATLADVLIRAGEHDVIVAGGMESMSNAPYLLPRARFGYTFGDGVLVDSMTSDGLTCTFDGLIMAEQNSVVSAEVGITRGPAGRVGAAQP